VWLHALCQRKGKKCINEALAMMLAKNIKLRRNKDSVAIKSETPQGNNNVSD
jgi:hypothetical protein